MSPVLRSLAVLFLLAGALGCEAGETIFKPSGQLTVVTLAQGGDVPSTFTVLVDERNEKEVDANGRVKFDNLETGTHTVAIRLPSNCVTGENPRTVEISEDETVTTVFEIQCG